MGTEHGAFSQMLFVASEGNRSEREEALSNVSAQLRRIADGTFVEQHTACALCDVLALRCADTNNRVQTAALGLVPRLFRVCEPSDMVR